MNPQILTRIALILSTTIAINTTPSRSGDIGNQKPRYRNIEIRLMDNQTTVNLRLGATSLSETVKLFPLPPGGMNDYEGRPREVRSKTEPASPTHSERVTVFNPWQSMQALYFDRNQRLIQIVTLGGMPEGRTTLTKEQATAMNLTIKEETFLSIEYESNPDACSTLSVGVDASGSDSIQGSAWSYRCATTTGEHP